jgi:hypothetical protein
MRAPQYRQGSYVRRTSVMIDGDFLRREVRDAVRQFFRPLTAPFHEPAEDTCSEPAQRGGSQRKERESA